MNPLRSLPTRCLTDVPRPLRLQGQIVVEYFLIFAAIAVLTILGMAWFDDAVRDTLQGAFRQAANRISK